MKKRTLFSLLTLLALGMTACKYEDGPLVSIKSKEARVVNTWVPETAEINGEDGIITDANGIKYIDGDSTGFYLALKEVSFLQTGGCLIVYKTSQDLHYQGVWSFQQNQEIIRLQCNPPMGGIPGVAMDWQILRLNENHLRVTYLWERNLFLVDFVTKE